MSTSKKITVNAFRIAFDKEDPENSEAHKALKKISRKKKKAVQIGDDTILLGLYETWKNERINTKIWRGQLRRLRKNDRVAEGNDKGKLLDVSLRPGNFITETSHFLMLPDYKTVLYLGSPQEVGWTVLRKYLSYYTEDDNPSLFMLPILRTDFAHKFQRAKLPTKIIINVAKPELWDIAKNPSVNTTLQSARIMSTEYANMTFGTGKGVKNRLKAASKEIYLAFVNAIEGHPHLSEHTAKLTMEAYESDESGAEKVILDYVDDRLSYVRTVDMKNVPTIAAWQKTAFETLELAAKNMLKQVKDSFIAKTK